MLSWVPQSFQGGARVSRVRMQVGANWPEVVSEIGELRNIGVVVGEIKMGTCVKGT